MRKIILGLTMLAASLALLMPVEPAQAQASSPFVSGTADDANPCSRTAPCLTFNGALAKTAAGGEINCFDSGEYGDSVNVAINKSIMIDCSAGGTLGGVRAQFYGISIGAGTHDVVVLRGLDINGFGGGLTGIAVNTVGALHIEQCRIRNNAGFGVAFDSAAAPSSLFISDTWITNNGSGNNGAGISIQPQSGSSVRAELSNVRIMGNSNGIIADGTQTSLASVIQVKSSTIAGSISTGVLITTVELDNPVVANNPAGINASGAASAVFMTGTTVFGSNNGVQRNNGGVVLSYQTNDIAGGNSPIDGAPNVMLNQN
ncbi:MAG: right-handed parallel beta-helix repeat-containing protein [Alphaproteobacteria bacterium]|nr:right-handed parallel beta-helix repeat-containing protein [Alphaproteobacteria bacterium]